MSSKEVIFPTAEEMAGRAASGLEKLIVAVITYRCKKTKE